MTFTNARRCRVLSGRWDDPYTGTVIDTARALDIDHLVPLKNAWDSGAWKWPQSERRAYANDRHDHDALIAVTASANRSKGDRGPDSWRPPAHHDWCRYSVDWISIKTRWSLTVALSEHDALEVMLQTCSR